VTMRAPRNLAFSRPTAFAGDWCRDSGDDDDQFRVVRDVLERDHSFADADGLDKGIATRLVAHVGQSGRLLVPKRLANSWKTNAASLLARPLV